MATFRRGAAEITKAMERKPGPRFVNNLWLNEDEKVYIQFLTPIEDMITALYHQYVITGFNKKTGKPIVNSFVSRKDPMLDGRDGYDPIWDRFGYKPVQRTFAIVAELEPEFVEKGGRKKVSSVTLKTRTWTDKDENEHEDPVFSLVAQAQSNFFGPLIGWEEDSGESVTDRVWSLVKRGKNKDVRYDLFAVPDIDPLDFSDIDEGHFIDLEAHLLSLSDRERVEELIDPLPDEWTISNFPPNDGRKVKSVTDSPAPKAIEADDSDPPFATDPPKKSRSKFAEMKARTEAAQAAKSE